MIKWHIHRERKADEALIDEWWSKWPDGGVAIVTGLISGIDVIDVDSIAGEDALIEALDKGGSLFKEPTPRTPRSGKHIYVQSQVRAIRSALFPSWTIKAREAATLPHLPRSPPSGMSMGYSKKPTSEGPHL